MRSASQTAVLPIRSGSARRPSSTRLLGQGRSGAVYCVVDETGRGVARKVFGSSGVTKLIQYLLLGAPNPYAWNEDAVACALLRRRILAVLVSHWFGDKLAVANAIGARWNSEECAFELDTELVDGKPAALRQPFAGVDGEQLGDLVERVMRPLQAHLVEAGFIGLVWQAGKGNPVALNNFLRRGRIHGRSDWRWSWIDLESGIPAVVPANPLALLCFYLPRAFERRRLLFDDVDTCRLADYLVRHQAALIESIGSDEYRLLCERVAGLELHQRRWHSMSRTGSALAWAVCRGRITKDQAQWYSAHRARWYARALVHGLAAGVIALAAGARRWFGAFNVAAFLSRCMAVLRLLGSHARRIEFCRELVLQRIAAWERRGQLSSNHASAMQTALSEGDGASDFLADFGAHLALKPLVKIVAYGLVPILLLLGSLEKAEGVLAITLGGVVARTLYTSVRLAQAIFQNCTRPWIALGVGLVPIVGTFAYPAQIVYSGAGARQSVAQFLIYDFFTALGRRVPVWGGADTLTEHVLNRVVSWMPRPREATVALPYTTAQEATVGLPPVHTSR